MIEQPDGRQSRRDLFRTAATVPLMAQVLATSDARSSSPARQEPIANPAGMIRLFDHLSTVQIQAIRAARAVDGLADTIETVCDQAGAQGMAVSLMPGAYDLRRLIRLHPRCWLVAETPGSWPHPTYNPGFGRDVGVVLVKNHNDPAMLLVQGGEDYATCGGIVGIALSGNPASPSSNKGDGLVIDRVGGYQIRGMKLFSMPRDGIVLGTSASDVTGHVVLDDVYVNNPGRYAIRNRSKWLKASKVATDGGTCSYFADAAPNADITQFHFEGASEAAIILDAGNGNSRFRGGFVGMTNRAATVALRLASAMGNVDITFRDIQITGHPDLPIGIDIGEAAWRASLVDCEIGPAKIGVRDLAIGTTIASTFLENHLPIEAHGHGADYRGSRFVGTRGPWGIVHYRGGGGLWTDIRTDRPFRSVAGGTPGLFGTNRVADNPGFRTGFRTMTAPGPSPLRVIHGIAIGPAIVIATEVGERLGTPGHVVEADDTAITIRWTGGGQRRFAIDARAPCETP